MSDDNDITPEERQRVHDERLARQLAAAKKQRSDDMKTALRETFSEPWFQESIGEALLAKLESIFSDMRPPRRVAEVRDGIEQMLADRDRRRKRGLFVKSLATSTGGDMAKTILQHVLTSAIASGLLLLGIKVVFW